MFETRSSPVSGIITPSVVIADGNQAFVEMSDIISLKSDSFAVDMGIKKGRGYSLR
jgi:hypothetical protein